MKPTCSTCRLAKDGRQCAYVSLRIRHSKYDARFEQQALVASSPIEALETNLRDGRTHVGNQDPAQRSTVLPVMALLSHHADQNSHTVDGQRPSSISGGEQQTASRLLSKNTGRQSGDSLTMLPLSSATSLNDRNWPMTSATDMAVFDYYIKHAGYWLDIVSPALHMSRTVPALARTDKLLRAACLAYAGHVLYLLGRLDRSYEETYSETALQLLIPKLSEDIRTWPGSVLAVTILLRTSEQFSEIGDDQQYHLNGAFSICAAAGRTWDANGADLESVCFWTYLRMTVRVCFLKQVAPTCDLSIIDEDVTLDGDAAFTNRITCILAKLCAACWSEHPSQDTAARLSDLADEVTRWRQNLPRTFEPWATIEPPDTIFGVLKYLHSWHAVAWQFFYAAEVLLAVYYRSTSRPSSILSQAQWIEREIVTPTRKLCAITMSCGEMGVEINGPHLMSWCGQYLTSRHEQTALVDWLDRFMSETKW